jgi:hypothetical protein
MLPILAAVEGVFVWLDFTMLERGMAILNCCGKVVLYGASGFGIIRQLRSATLVSRSCPSADGDVSSVFVSHCERCS